MKQQNRPYKGRAAELAELDAFRASTSNAPDTVIEAGKKCLLIGGFTAPLLIGFPFLIAAFVLGVFAMATDRLHEGLKVSLLALTLFAVLAVAMYVLLITFAFGLMMAIFSSTLSHLPR